MPSCLPDAAATLVYGQGTPRHAAGAVLWHLARQAPLRVVEGLKAAGYAPVEVAWALVSSARSDLVVSVPAGPRSAAWWTPPRAATGTKGGAGSGNFGHAGRPGLVGGSAAGMNQPAPLTAPNTVAVADLTALGAGLTATFEHALGEAFPTQDEAGYVYHGTFADRLVAIGREGLRPNMGQTFPGYSSGGKVSFAPNPIDAQYWTASALWRAYDQATESGKNAIPRPVLLRVRREAVRDLAPTQRASELRGLGVGPADLEIWQRGAWHPLAQHVATLKGGAGSGNERTEATETPHQDAPALPLPDTSKD